MESHRTANMASGDKAAAFSSLPASSLSALPLLGRFDGLLFASEALGLRRHRC